MARIELDLASLLVGRDTVLRQYVETVTPLYDYVIVDTAPTLGLLTVNALAAADSVIIPVTPKFLDAKGLELLLKTIFRVKRQINPALQIDGILISMIDQRTNISKKNFSRINEAYGEHIRIFENMIPFSVKAKEASDNFKSIIEYLPDHKISLAYKAFTQEVLNNGKQ